MLDILHQFQERIKRLRSFLDDAEAINALADAGIGTDGEFEQLTALESQLARLRSSRIDRRVQTYASFIILLYGVFEQYVEDALMAYLEELSTTITEFTEMPEKIRKNHTALSAQLLLNMDHDKYRERCNAEEIVKRLQSWIREEPFSLNPLAFTDHRSNFRHESLNQFFEAAGVSSILARIGQTTAFGAYRDKRFVDQEFRKLNDKTVFEDLNDLVSRRNAIGHGWPEDNMLAVEMMRERAEFVQILGESIYEVLRQDALRHIVKHRGVALPKPFAVFRNSIVCFRLETGAIAQGSHIVACRSPRHYLEGVVETIEIDHVRQTEVVAPPAVELGCRVSFRAKENYSYFLVNDPLNT